VDIHFPYKRKPTRMPLNWQRGVGRIADNDSEEKGSVKSASSALVDQDLGCEMKARAVNEKPQPLQVGARLVRSGSSGAREAIWLCPPRFERTQLFLGWTRRNIHLASLEEVLAERHAIVDEVLVIHEAAWAVVRLRRR
jgi:hypothetical protein